MTGQRPVEPPRNLAVHKNPRVLGAPPDALHRPRSGPFFVEQQAMRHAELIDLATIDISAVDLPTKNERLLRDAKFAGLALRLRASGARSWMLIVGPLGLSVPHRPHPNASSRFGIGVRD